VNAVGSKEVVRKDEEGKEGEYGVIPLPLPYLLAYHKDKVVCGEVEARAGAGAQEGLACCSLLLEIGPRQRQAEDLSKKKRKPSLSLLYLAL
jgi:hypothetical protein